LGVIAASAATLLHLSAQDATIRTTVPLVTVPTTVTDRKGHYIDALGPDDFVVYDNGKSRSFQVVPADAILAPISLVVAVQSSDIAAAVLAKIQKVGSMVQPLILGEKGEAALLAFDQQTKLLQDFTSDPAAISAAFHDFKPGSERDSRIFDTVAVAVRMLGVRGPNARRVILLISESRDRGSTSKLPETIALAERNNVIIFPATFSAYATPFTAKPSDLPAPPTDTNLLAIFTETGRMAKKNAAAALARYSGGRHVSFLTLNSLEHVISLVGQELHNQYLLSFQPSATEKPGFHSVKVEIRDRPELVVRARAGYWLEASAE
jgi:VWFA-related protein